MPPVGRGLSRLTQDEIEAVTRWIDADTPAFDPLLEARAATTGNEYILASILADVRTEALAER